MNSRSLRGTRLGSLSMETDEGVLAAPRQEAVYDCPNGHTIVLPFSVEADVPAVWECRCGASALLRDHERPEAKAGKPVRTHWDMLLERRSEEDLQVLLDQRLALLRSGRLHQRRNL
ncbi:electron transporter [Brachybacterium sp. P6-10-X1]|uniref:RNA polymerase-binding protein RbpA n=1 Tax=Brachybacterium sp. P6-10-X1 TaxID=1903186 RepID=UPI0009717DD4|nr:RNA polymerase-binding protein RbpA [Brachybacterium sp. P6-10-X1]APX31930.1 electron transporter [Brachybacterium sp. P6-10-X1]